MMSVSPMAAAKYGNDAAAVKARVSPKQWKNILAYAKKQGYTVAGAVSGNSPALRERNNSYLMGQARRVVGQAYDPALKALDTQQSQLSALSDKRKADNAAYQQWLLGKQAQYNAQAQASQQQYQTYLDNLKATTQAAHEQAQAGATAAVQGQPGTVSDLKQSTALQGLSADTTRATGLVDNARQQTAAMLPSLEMRQNARQQAVIGQGQAADAKRINDLNTGLQSLYDQRTKTLASKASDILKTYLNGISQQIDVANSNRNYGAAASKLGLDQQKLNFDQTKFNKSYGLSKQQLAEKQSNDQAKIKIGYDRIAAQKGKAAADRKLKLYLANHKSNVLSPKDQEKMFQSITTAAGALHSLHDNSPNGQVAVTDSKGNVVGHRTYRDELRARGFSDAQIEVAIDIYAHNGKLSPYGQKLARKLGIQHPYAMLGKADIGTSYNGPH